MSLADRTRRAVESTLQRFEREHGTFEVVGKTWMVSEWWYDRTRTRVEAGALGGAGVWLIDDAGRVLLVRREGEDRWEEPGGKHEPDETFAETARRETREEAGVAPELTGVEQAHRITVTLEGADDPDLAQLFVIFGGEPVAGEPRPEEGEIAEVRWWEEHPQALHYEELRRIPVPAAESTR